MRNCDARMFVVMVLIALWHGANWTFVAWGAYHRAKAWDQNSFLAKSGVASTPLQLLVDTLSARRS